MGSVLSHIGQLLHRRSEKVISALSYHPRLQVKAAMFIPVICHTDIEGNFVLVVLANDRIETRSIRPSDILFVGREMRNICPF